MDSEQRFSQAKEMFQQGENTEALDILRQLAQEDYPPAQYYLGMLYYEGRKVEADRELAYKWLDQAAAAGNAEAQFMLGSIYYGGDGRETRSEDENLAADYFEKAAKQGHAMSQYYLGSMSHSIHGGNIEKSIEWLQKAVDQGVVDAALELGYYYVKGIGVPQDIARGWKLIKSGADAGNGAAQSVTGNWYLNGEYVTRNLDMAVKYLQMAVDNGYDGAKRDLETALKSRE